MNNKLTVLVNASFEKGEALFAWCKKYATHADENFVYWDDVAFTTQETETCDAVLIFNTASATIYTNCNPGKVIAFMMEPGIEAVHPWMFRQLTQYAKVYSPVVAAGNSIPSHGFLGWYLGQDYPSLSALQPPVKTALVSCIASNLTALKGHRLRYDFIQALKKEMPQIGYFGKGSNYIREKTDGLLPYRYSIALENTSIPYYFTEKINDCFLAYTVPLYYGCTNIKKYFPEGAYIPIDITDTRKAIHTIRKVIENDDWDKRVGPLQEARALVLNKYQPLAGAAGIIKAIAGEEKKQVLIRPVTHSLPGKIKYALAALLGKKY